MSQTRGPGSQPSFQFIPKEFDGVKVRVLRGAGKFNIKFTQPCLYEPFFVHWSTVNRKGFLQLSPQSWKHRIVQNVLLICPLSETIGTTSIPEKQLYSIIPPAPHFEGTCCSQVGNVLFTKPRLINQTARQGSVIPQATEMVMLCTSLYLTLGGLLHDVRLA